MVMLQMSGGMGNQMFQYALYLALQEAGKEVCIDDHTMYAANGRADNRLEQIFSLHYHHGNRKTYNRLTDSSMALWNRVRRKLLGRKGKLYQEKDALIYEEGIWEAQDCYCIGYWQSQRYFDSVKEEVRQVFQFPWERFPEKVLAYRKQMEGCNAVSIHVRRGDYLSEQFSPIYGGICTEAYYRAAIAYLKERYKDGVFFLFTNDTAWGRTIAAENIILVECSEEGSAERDMALMSCCRHHIIANSSFSWWGAWLGRNPDKIVIAPDRWLNISEGQDIYKGLCTVKIDADGRVTSLQ